MFFPEFLCSHTSKDILFISLVDVSILIRKDTSFQDIFTVKFSVSEISLYNNYPGQSLLLWTNIHNPCAGDFSSSIADTPFTKSWFVKHADNTTILLPWSSARQIRTGNFQDSSSVLH